MSKEKICGIYKITSPSGKIYIGQAVNIYKRWIPYNSVNCKSQRLLFRSLKKYGVDNHKFEIIEECPEEMLNDREVYYIKYFGAFDTPHGLNLTPGGDGYKKSEDHKRRISEAHKRWWKKNHRVPSEEQKRKYSIYIKEYWKNATKEERLKRGDAGRGKKRTEEEKKIMSERAKKYWETHERKPDSEETKRKKGVGSKKMWQEKRDEIIAAQRGKKRTEEQKVNYKKGALKRWESIPKEDRKLSEEHKKKISKAGEGNKYALGYKHTDETKAKISETSKVNSKKYWDELKKDEKSYNEACKKNKEAQLKYWEEKIKASGLTMEEYENIRKEKRKEQKKRAYATWLEKNRNTEEYKRKQNEKGMRSYYKNRDRITEMRKSKRQLEKERIRQEKLTMVF